MERQQRSDARRNRELILEAAAEAFAVHGIEASLEEIARQAGVGVGTLYRHFPTRNALIEAVFRRSVDRLVDSADVLLETLPPVEALARWMTEFVSYVAAKKGLASHLKSVVAADSELFTYSHQRMDATIQRLVAAAAADGSIRADVDPMDVLRGLSGVCLMSEGPGWQDQACRISRLLMDGLRYGVPPEPAQRVRRARIRVSNPS
jgi:AcrR family transcriptional regulator